MEEVPLYIYFIALAFLFVLSAFFSGSETALMRINRYRLAHLAGSGHRGAKRVLKLLEKPEQLIALILLGNNFVNIIIAQLAAYIGYRLHGEIGIAIATAVLTFLLLTLAELAPKTLATLRPQQVALPAGLIYTLLQPVLYPFTKFASLITAGLFKMFGISGGAPAVDSLSREELRTALTASKKLIPYDYHGMLVGVLDLESKTVEDIMVPRNEIAGIDLNQPHQDIEDSLNRSLYTRMPVFRDTIDNIIGVLHARGALRASTDNALNIETIEESVRKPYFVSEHTHLIDALREFKQQKRRMALVVDEYGTIQGLVTMDDLLEEIVGEFTNDPGTYDLEITRRPDGSVLVDGGCHVREINRLLGWELDESGPKTVNGLLLESLEMIPQNPVCVMIDGHPVEVVKTLDNTIKLARIAPPMEKAKAPWTP